MTLMAWQDNYSVHVPKIDSQHQHLFQLVNELHDAMTKGRANEVMGAILNELVTYTKTHFQTEEELMQSKNYPDLEAHRSEHNRLTDQVMQLQKGFSAGRTMVSIQTMHFLRDWLTNHILHSDKRYDAFMNASQ
ncbi:MAG TPA: bacteriohemerythrin [Terriglobales bacterium]|nr:bacteriohemerythrin [Terriglobales bacterium]